MASWPAFALPLARAKNHRYRRRARDKCGSRFDTGFTLEITLVHRPIARARAACAPALRENKLDWGREGRKEGRRRGGEEGTGFLRPKDSFQASSVRQLGMGKNERRGRERERETRSTVDFLPWWRPCQPSKDPRVY